MSPMTFKPSARYTNSFLMAGFAHQHPSAPSWTRPGRTQRESPSTLSSLAGADQRACLWSTSHSTGSMVSLLAPPCALSPLLLLNTKVSKHLNLLCERKFALKNYLFVCVCVVSVCFESCFFCLLSMLHPC